MCSNNLKLPIRAAPYRHQREAFYFFVLRLFGLLSENEGNDNETDDGSV